MNELKTLKNLKYYVGGETNQGDFCLHQLIDTIELKKEAIKWIKKLESLRNPIYKCEDSDGLEVYNIEYECFDSDAMERWIKHFFNIEDEDLK